MSEDNKPMDISDETFTFTTKNNKVTFTVKKSFLAVCDILTIPKDDKEEAQLMHENKMGNYLHNPNGPAIFVPSTGYKEYHLHGKKLEKDEEAAFEARLSYNKELNKVINE